MAHSLLFVCRGGPAKNALDDDQVFIEIEIVNNAVVPDPAPPCSFLSLETLKVSLEGIGLHCNEYRFNALLLFSRELLKVFLCRTGD
jgi:hypothetical protein